MNATPFESQIFVQKFNFDKTPTFLPKIFLDNFSREIKSCQQLKSLKLQHFHEFFTQKNRQFEDFEQCVNVDCGSF